MALPPDSRSDTARLLALLAELDALRTETREASARAEQSIATVLDDGEGEDDDPRDP